VTWVKVCGLRTATDVNAAVEAGADAVGFVLAESPRRVSVETAGRLGEGVPVHRVLVTVDALPEQLLRWVGISGATGVQPHGKHAVAAGGAAGAKGLLVLHPVPVRGLIDLGVVPDDRIPLLDTYAPLQHGGTGAAFDWSLLQGLDRDFVLAGGLGPANVAEAIARIHPWGVDASSGLESGPGIKDPDLIKAFVREAKTV